MFLYISYGSRSSSHSIASKAASLTVILASLITEDQQKCCLIVKVLILSFTCWGFSPLTAPIRALVMRMMMRRMRMRMRMKMMWMRMITATLKA